MRIAQPMTRLGAAVALALVITNTSDSRGELAGDSEAALKAALPAGQKYGFRHDPMKWATESDSLRAAMVRTHVLKKTKEGDVEAIRKAAAEMLARLKKNLGDAGPHGLIEVAHRLGLAEAKEIGQLVFQRNERDENGEWSIYHTIAMCYAGLAAEKEVRASVEKWAKRVKKENPWHTCPWGAFLKMQVLWLGRDVADTAGALDQLVKAINGAASPIGAVNDKDPWSFLHMAGLIEHPVMGGVVERSIPMILRAQKGDGGWGGGSFGVFRALHRHGLIDPLRKLPPLPADWRIVRSIPVPADKLRTMAWDGERLWVCRPHSSVAVALSPENGEVIKTIDLGVDKIGGMGWCDGALAFSRNGEQKQLLKVNPGTGKIVETIDLQRGEDLGGIAQLAGKTLICDCWMPCAWDFDPARGGRLRYRLLAGPAPVGLAAQDDSVWHYDWMMPLLIRSDAHGKLLDYGEEPLRGISGVAWDGKHLWVLDNKSKRICMIEKTPAGREVTERIARRRELEARLRELSASLKCSGPVELAAGERALTFECTPSNPFPSPIEIRYVWEMAESTWSVEPVEGTVKLAPGGKALMRSSATLNPDRPAPLPVRRSTVFVDGKKVGELQHRPTPPILRRFASVVRVAKAPVLDGEIAKGEYAAAKALSTFGYYKGHGPAKHDTSVLLACDDQAFYIGLTMEESDPDGIVGEPRKRDGVVWLDDSLEIFLDATIDRSTYHRLAVSLKHCVQKDSLGGPGCGPYGKTTWNGEWQSVSRIGEGEVVMELAIPFKTLGVKAPRRGDRWGLNICRKRNARAEEPQELSAWCYTYTDWHVPTHFGTVTFE